MDFDEWWERYKKLKHYTEVPYVDQSAFSMLSLKAAAKTAWDAAKESERAKFGPDHHTHGW